MEIDMQDILIWTITLCGLLSLTLIVLKALREKEDSIVLLIVRVNAFSIKLASISIVLYLVYSVYTQTGGTLSLISIGFYVACITVMLETVKGLAGNNNVVRNFSSIIAHKADLLEKTLEEKANEIKLRNESKG
jgi:hypothetical protein